MEARLQSINHLFQEAEAAMESLKPRMKDLQDGIIHLDALFRDQIVRNVQVRAFVIGKSSNSIADNTYSRQRTLSLTDLMTRDSYKRY